MQDAMHQQFVESGFHAHTSILCFSIGRIRRYHDIAQKMGCQMGIIALAHGEGNDIRRSRAVKIFLVESGNLRIIY